jgi:hypothetical protein
VTEIERLEAGQVRRAEPRRIAPSVRRVTGRDVVVGELVAALPPRQSFGRRG